MRPRRGVTRQKFPDPGTVGAASVPAPAGASVLPIDATATMRRRPGPSCPGPRPAPARWRMLPAVSTACPSRIVVRAGHVVPAGHAGCRTASTEAAVNHRPRRPGALRHRWGRTAPDSPAAGAAPAPHATRIRTRGGEESSRCVRSYVRSASGRFAADLTSPDGQEQSGVFVASRGTPAGMRAPAEAVMDRAGVPPNGREGERKTRRKASERSRSTQGGGWGRVLAVRAPGPLGLSLSGSLYRGWSLPEPCHPMKRPPRVLFLLASWPAARRWPARCAETCRQGGANAMDRMRRGPCAPDAAKSRKRRCAPDADSAEAACPCPTLSLSNTLVRTAQETDPAMLPGCDGVPVPRARLVTCGLWPGGHPGPVRIYKRRKGGRPVADIRSSRRREHLASEPIKTADWRGAGPSLPDLAGTVPAPADPL